MKAVRVMFLSFHFDMQEDDLFSLLTFVDARQSSDTGS
jgi:hypothetical protein